MERVSEKGRARESNKNMWKGKKNKGGRLEGSRTSA